MKKIKKMLVAVLGLMVASPVVMAAEPMINKEDKVVVGFDDTFAPFGFKDEKGNIVGFDVDLASAVFDKMGVEFEFQPIDWSTKETELNTGNIDMIWNGYTITDEREKVVAFSDAYIDNRQVIIVKADNGIESKADLADKVVATQAESSALEAILADEAFTKTIDGATPITYATFVEVFADLDNGRADAIVVDETLATYYLSQKDNADSYRILEDNFGEEEYAVGFRKSDSEFVEEFNAALKAVTEDGTFDEIKAKWFVEIKE
ncbi:amino acid ABC transporter substrate-binding protein [Globicatella sp. PHS-GS-PNBC-21-1553]|uniref:amino acid ABC transporter substrate-binding protein n=1 Tax=Globicatella sp. PHS-GS-PNBC-21-1553 TaxID=2885764 RepID=UPI00298EDEDE|nr:amino acid ABC transporter substrate-binding protein [Globicatella sp. PHS-GS-PNBC-21-1553]WPC07936.1 amino acid ABC transporter substrate-binding protein [Globicatella sp. PHS-GS-PNBC-21-1553]